MSEDHEKTISEAKYEQPPTRWNNLWSHTLLAHETRKVHKRKSTKKVIESISSIFDLKSFASFRVLRGQEATGDLKQRRDNRRKSTDVAELSAGSAT
jgi:hypothetical protein